MANGSADVCPVLPERTKIFEFLRLSFELKEPVEAVTPIFDQLWLAGRLWPLTNLSWRWEALKKFYNKLTKLTKRTNTNTVSISESKKLAGLGVVLGLWPLAAHIWQTGTDFKMRRTLYS